MRYLQCAFIFTQHSSLPALIQPFVVGQLAFLRPPCIWAVPAQLGPYSLLWLGSLSLFWSTANRVLMNLIFEDKVQTLQPTLWRIFSSGFRVLFFFIPAIHHIGAVLPPHLSTPFPFRWSASFLFLFICFDMRPTLLEKALPARLLSHLVLLPLHLHRAFGWWPHSVPGTHVQHCSLSV